MRIFYPIFLKSLCFIVGLFLLTACQSTTASDAAVPENQQQFIDQMVSKHGFDRAKLETVFSQVKRQPKILVTMTTPHEAKPWYEYRKTFLKPERVQAGVEFWRENAKTLTEAERRYGVPADMIVGILGVETYYGKITGNYRVIDVLTTLAFDYPRRAPFFRSELEQFLLLSREQGWDPLAIKGSYAGAMGKPQFMPSSYRRYAVSYTGKPVETGSIDLMTNNADIIMSIANYLKQNGWRPGESIASSAKVTGTQYQSIPDRDLKLKLTIAQLKQRGVTPNRPLPPANRAAFLKLEGASAPEYWVGFHNFYALSRYNPRINYTMVVYQLGEKVRIAYNAPSVNNVTK
jgi:membrane-bound lytic murein transglycosylase B